MKKLSFEELIERKSSNRFNREGRALSKLEKRENAAEAMIGELVRDGRTVSYIFPAGGKYREGTRAQLVSFLIRNHYA